MNFGGRLGNEKVKLISKKENTKNFSNKKLKILHSTTIHIFSSSQIYKILIISLITKKLKLIDNHNKDFHQFGSPSYNWKC